MRTQDKLASMSSDGFFALPVVHSYRSETLEGNIGTMGHTETTGEKNRNGLCAMQPSLPFPH